MAQQYFYELYFYTLMLNKIEDIVLAVLIVEHGIHHYLIVNSDWYTCKCFKGHV